MGYVEGHILRDADERREGARSRPAARRAGESLVDVLADIHAVDVDAVGLGDLGRREGYIARQLKRWYGQYQQSKEMGGPDVAAVDRVHDLLAERIPEQGRAAIVHGDYRLDNTILGDDGTVRAVLDWEICTLGDPLADVGLLMVYWAEPGEQTPALLVAPTTVPGFPSRAELRDRYAARSGRDLADLDFYVAFGYWKLACILEGVFARYAGGRGRWGPQRLPGLRRAGHQAGRGGRRGGGPPWLANRSWPGSTAGRTACERPVLVLGHGGLDRRRPRGGGGRHRPASARSTPSRSPPSTATCCSTSGPAGRSCGSSTASTPV